ncbi:MAG: hypothetical protein ABIJ00_00190 [Candidatus Eisenbacteria bacterium]
MVVSLAAVVVLASVNLANAHGLDLAIGWHRLAEEAPPWRGPETGGRLPGGQPLYSLGMFFNDFGDRHKARFGLRYTTHQTLHEIDGIGRSFRMQSFLLDYQRQLLWHKPFRVVADVCVGLSTFSTHVPYPYNYSDDFSIHLHAPATVVPGLGWQCQVASQFTLQAGLWYYWLLGDSDKVTPFRSSFALTFGLGYTMSTR